MNTEALVTAFGDNIKLAVEQLAAAAGVAVSEVWRVLLQQAKVEGYLALCGIAGMVFLTITLAIFWRSEPTKPYGQFSEMKVVYGTLTIGAAIVNVVVMKFLLWTAFTAIFNPEYYAGMKVMEAAQHLIK